MLKFSNLNWTFLESFRPISYDLFQFGCFGLFAYFQLFFRYVLLVFS